MAQAKGSASQVLLYKEDAYRDPPASIAAVSMPFKSISLKGSRGLNDSEMMRGDRNAAMPDFGNQDAGGSMIVPLDLRAIGYWLQGLIGAPTTVQQAAKPINNGGAAVNRSGGVVGIPVTNHGYQPGETVVIAGTVSYNGTYTVLAGSTVDEVRITATYQAETFGPDDTIRAHRYTHTFKVHPSDSLYSYGIEKGFTDIGQYFVYEGCKFGKMSFEVGGDKSEIFVNIEILGATESAASGSSVDPSPTTIDLSKFGNFEAAVTEGGAPSGAIKSMSIDIDNRLDGDTFVIGGGGVRGSINEGICFPSGSLEVMFEDGALYNKAVMGTESSIVLTFTKGVHSLIFTFNEVLYEREGFSVETPTGIWLKAPWRAYLGNDAGASCVTVTLVNDVAGYAWS